MMEWKAAARSAVKTIAGRMGIRIRPRLRYDRGTYEALRGLRPWSSQDVIFDVGANDGRTILRLEKYLPGPRIFAFEPVASTFRTLTERTRHLPNVQRFQLAFGTETGRRTMYLNESAALNSLYPEWGASDRTEEIEMTTLDRFVAQQGVDRIHLLKIDAEGHDLEVLKGAEETLKAMRVDVIQVEAGFSAPGKSQPALEEFQEYLRRFDYYLWGVHNQCHGRPMSYMKLNGNGGAGDSPSILVYCDAIFINLGPEFSAALKRRGDCP